jgi:hypothetical protein
MARRVSVLTLCSARRSSGTHGFLAEAAKRDYRSEGWQFQLDSPEYFWLNDWIWREVIHGT